MGNTYTQIHLQVVFAVQERACVIRRQWKEELYRYLTGIVQNYGHKVLAINGMPDHVHLLFGMRPTQSLTDLMQLLKGDPSNDDWCAGDFRGRKVTAHSLTASHRYQQSLNKSEARKNTIEQRRFTTSTLIYSAGSRSILKNVSRSNQLNIRRPI